MVHVQVLIDDTGGPTGVEADDERLAAVYADSEPTWLRVNMVSTLDGAATGPDGRSDSINNSADKRVFRLLRRMADAIVVGAGTARTERYGEARCPVVVVTRGGNVPERLRSAAPGKVLLATCASAPGLQAARRLLGDENLLVAGEEAVDLGRIRHLLVERGFRSLLSEGGPTLLADLLDAGVVDEICATVVPRAVGGRQTRITSGPEVDVPLRLVSLLEEEGTLLGRWLVSR